MRQGCSIDYQPIDTMFEQALSGPMSGPLLRLFLAQYLRCVLVRHMYRSCQQVAPSLPHQVTGKPWHWQGYSLLPTSSTLCITRLPHLHAGAHGWPLWSVCTPADVCVLYLGVMRACCTQSGSESRVHVRNRHLELNQLRALQAMPLPFDVRFFVVERMRELKALDKADRGGGGACAPLCSSNKSPPCMFLLLSSSLCT